MCLDLVDLSVNLAIIRSCVIVVADVFYRKQLPKPRNLEQSCRIMTNPSPSSGKHPQQKSPPPLGKKPHERKDFPGKDRPSQMPQHLEVRLAQGIVHDAQPSAHVCILIVVHCICAHICIHTRICIACTRITSHKCTHTHRETLPTAVRNIVSCTYVHS